VWLLMAAEVSYTPCMSSAVAAGDPITAEAGAAILRVGGNAVDALIAAALASFLAEPLLASAGGAGVMTLDLPGEDPVSLDFFSVAPGLGGSPERLDFEAVDIDFGSANQRFHVGRGSVAVPLALPGLAMAAERFGSLPLADLIQPALAIARDGYTIAPSTAHVFRLLWPIMARDSATRDLYGVDGGPPPVGTIQRNPEFGNLLVDFARTGGVPACFDEGLLQAFSPTQGGLISEPDLRGATPCLRAPFTIELGGYEFVSSPLPGGRLASVILSELIRESAGSSDVEKTLHLARAARAGHDARDALTTPGSTTQLSAMDASGGAASLTLTNGEGCGHLIPGTGVQANNFLGEEDLNPHGFHQHSPGVTLPTMLAPTILRRQGRPVLALGSGGSNRIRSAVAAVLYQFMQPGAALDTSVSAPRVHAEGQNVWFELPDASDEALFVKTLSAEFQSVFPFPGRDFFFGGVHSVGRTTNGQLVAVGDARRGGHSVVIDD